MQPKVTRTTNRLPFGELDPRRFEDLCLGLLYRMRPWREIQHVGRLGADGGVDLLAEELLDDRSVRTWHVQCRRYTAAGAAVLKAALDDILKRSGTVDVAVVVVACDVSRKALEAFKKHAAKKNIKEATLWTSSILEAKLYGDRPDLLFTFFGISLNAETRSRETRLHRNMAMKRRVRDELQERPPPGSDLHRQPWLAFSVRDVVIHSVDDSTYPRTEEANGLDISGWFRSSFFDCYHNGVEVLLHNAWVFMAEDGRWAPTDFRTKEAHPGRSGFFPVHVVGCIPYRNIVELDPTGDEYYSCPHLYCRFDEAAGEPYEEFRYRFISDEYPQHLSSELQAPLHDLLT